ncbi:MAG: metallophosphoesterase family protein [Paracoccaceae bacterium]
MQLESRNIKDLGRLSGDVLVFGGPYSNLQASEALLLQARSRGIPPSNRICTGDMVAYCANPLETLDILDNQCEWLAGNCEKQLAKQSEDCGCGFEAGSACDLLSRGWYPYASAAIENKYRQRMSLCPDMIVFQHHYKRIAVIHGGSTDISRFIWPVSPEEYFLQEIKAIEDEIGTIDMVLSGHSGIAFQRQIGLVQWVNAGVIGMPANDGNQTTQYLVLTETNATIETLVYDHQTASAAMGDAGLTQGYEIALKTGYWPSQDVLPFEMRK